MAPGNNDLTRSIIANSQVLPINTRPNYMRQPITNQELSEASMQELSEDLTQEQFEQKVKEISYLMEKRATTTHGLYYFIGRLIGTINEDGSDTGWYPLDSLADNIYNWIFTGDNNQDNFDNENQTDSVREEPIDLNIINQRLQYYYHHLEDKIKTHQQKAQESGKGLLIVVGESHYGDAETYIQHFIFSIAYKMGISKFFHEYPKPIDLEKVIDYCDIGYMDSFKEDIETAQKYKMQYVPIDTYDRADNYETTSSIHIKARNKIMVETINNHAKWSMFWPAESGVVIIGGHHMIGLSSSFEGHTIDRSKYEVLEINLFESNYRGTIDQSLVKEVEAYYNSQDKSYFSIIEELEGMIQKNSNDVRACFNEFIKQKDHPHTENTLLYNFPGRLKRAVEKEEMVEFDRIMNLDPNIDINEIDCHGFGQIHHASRTSVKMAKFVLSRGANINLRDNRGYSALFYAIKDGNLDIVQFLLTKGIDVNDPKSALLAAGRNKINILRILLNHGLNVNIHDDRGNTPLHAAARYGLEDAYNFLLGHGANPSSENKLGLTAAEFADFNGKKVGTSNIDYQRVKDKLAV